VLLLATETDLRVARKTVAEQLRRSLGVTVSERPASEHRDYDLVVLMQAWWWDVGQCARRWEQFNGPKLIFLVDEQADWPPRKLVQCEADNDLRKFRASLKNPPLFKTPEQLPELVVKAVTQFMHSQGGGLDLAASADS